MMTTEMPAAIRPYSMAVAPSSLRRKRVTSLRILYSPKAQGMRSARYTSDLGNNRLKKFPKIVTVAGQAKPRLSGGALGHEPRVNAFGISTGRRRGAYSNVLTAIKKN